MSVLTYFSMATGFSRPLLAPAGTLQKMLDHIADVEAKLCLEHEVYNNHHRWRSAGLPPRYSTLGCDSPDYKTREVARSLLCETVEKHNNKVRWLYDMSATWQLPPACLPMCDKPIDIAGSVPAGKEIITPEQAQQFWYGLEMLSVPTEWWTSEYYRARMESAYETMRGRQSEGNIFDAPALTEQQASCVIRLFEQFIDNHDLDLEVPDGHDRLASSYYGEYQWCSDDGDDTTGCYKAIATDDISSCQCSWCPLKEPEEREALQRDERLKEALIVLDMALTGNMRDAAETAYSHRGYDWYSDCKRLDVNGNLTLSDSTLLRWYDPNDRFGNGDDPVGLQIHDRQPVVPGHEVREASKARWTECREQIEAVNSIMAEWWKAENE